MKFRIRTKTVTLGLSLMIGLGTIETNASQVFGTLCFSSPQEAGQVNQKDLITVEPDGSGASPENLKQANESWRSYFQRLNQSLESTDPHTFDYVQKWASSTTVDESQGEPAILLKRTIEEAKRYGGEPCYRVVMGYSVQNNSNLHIHLTPFANLYKVEDRSAIAWQALTGYEPWTLNKTKAYENSPTAIYLFERMKNSAQKLIFTELRNFCQTHSSDYKQVCDPSTLDLLADSELLHSKFHSQVAKSCLKEIARTKGELKSLDACIRKKAIKPTPGAAIKELTNRNADSLAKAYQNNIFEGLWMTFFAIPLTTATGVQLYGAVKVHDEQEREYQAIQRDVQELPPSQLAEVQMVLQKKIPTMSAMLDQQEYRKNRHLLEVSRLSADQKGILFGAVQKLTLNGFFFSHLIVGQENATKDYKRELEHLLDILGPQDRW